MKKFLIHFTTTRTLNRAGDKFTETKTEIIELPTAPKLPQYNVEDLKSEDDIKKLENWIKHRDFDVEPKKVIIHSFSKFESN